MITYVMYFLVGVLGLLFHMLINIKGLRDHMLAANMDWSFKAYLKKDWLSYLLSLLAIVILLVTWTEVVGWQPDAARFAKAVFLVMGYAGDSILQAFFSKANKQLLQVVDEKTNFADGKITPNTN